jgi:hypothetical protein
VLTSEANPLLATGGPPSLQRAGSDLRRRSSLNSRVTSSSSTQRTMFRMPASSVTAITRSGPSDRKHFEHGCPVGSTRPSVEPLEARPFAMRSTFWWAGRSSTGPSARCTSGSLAMATTSTSTWATRSGRQSRSRPPAGKSSPIRPCDFAARRACSTCP